MRSRITATPNFTPSDLKNLRRGQHAAGENVTLVEQNVRNSIKADSLRRRPLKIAAPRYGARPAKFRQGAAGAWMCDPESPDGPETT
jgi:hypothetical protein